MFICFSKHLGRPHRVAGLELGATILDSVFPSSVEFCAPLQRHAHRGAGADTQCVVNDPCAVFSSPPFINRETECCGLDFFPLFKLSLLS